jgi:hypothetical protein
METINIADQYGKMGLAFIFIVFSKMQCVGKEYKRFAMRFEGCASLCKLKFLRAFFIN